jgi:hypothetical protein
MNPLQMMNMVNQLKSNPMSILGQYGVPQNISNDPQAIIQNLMNSGKISQQQYNNAMQMARNMGFKI